MVQHVSHVQRGVSGSDGRKISLCRRLRESGRCQSLPNSQQFLFRPLVFPSEKNGRVAVSPFSLVQRSRSASGHVLQRGDQPGASVFIDGTLFYGLC